MHPQPPIINQQQPQAAFLLVPEAEWRAVLSRVAQLEDRTAPKPDPAADPRADEILTVREAAALLRMTEEGVRKARRAKRLTGIQINEKAWGFRRAELTRYLTRYQRAAR